MILILTKGKDKERIIKEMPHTEIKINFQTLLNVPKKICPIRMVLNLVLRVHFVIN